MAREITQHIILVTGKGGVGKSTVAAVVAQSHAKKGKKTLLVELGERSQYCYLFDKEVGYEPQEVAENLSVSLWSGEACLKEYLYHLIRIQKIVDLFFDNRIMKAFINAAPALRELAVTGKITSGARNWGPELNFDVIVVDAFATGHFLALVQAPQGIGEMVTKGPMGDQCRHIHEVLSNPSVTDYMIVTLPEDLPVLETLELEEAIHEKLNQKAKIVLNKWFSSESSSSEFRSMGGDFANYLADLMDRQELSLQKLSEHKKLPLCFSPHYKDVVSELGQSWGRDEPTL